MAATNDGDTVKTVLLPALQELNQELAKLVENGRKKIEAMKSDRLDEFLNVDCEVGFRSTLPVFLYVGCLKRVGVNTWAGLVEMWKGCYHDEEVRVCVEEFLSIEKSLQDICTMRLMGSYGELRTSLPSPASLRWVNYCQQSCLSWSANQGRLSSSRLFGSNQSSHSLFH